MFVLVLNNEIVLEYGSKFDCERKLLELEPEVQDNAFIIPAWYNECGELEW